jgi:NAD(P)-dependent dehydrogenase (short-subunit alcohol dehydrogenase family)
MELGLRGKCAVVTGSAQGLGAAIVEGFVNEGASVVMADTRINEAKELADKLGKGKTRVMALKIDVTKKSDADRLSATAMEEFGKIDILVNNAGVVRYTEFLDIDEEEWDFINDVNAKGFYLVTKAVVPHMTSNRHGKIVNVSSRSGKEGQPCLSHYAASKFAILGFTQALAKELAQYDINVNAVCPGVVRTPLWDGILDTRSKREGLPPEQIFSNWIYSIPLKRPQNPEDIANVVLFLSSELSKNITGEAININGGSRMD